MKAAGILCALWIGCWLRCSGQTNEPAAEYEYAAPTNRPAKPSRWLPYGPERIPEYVLRLLFEPLQWVPRAVDHGRVGGWGTSPLSPHSATWGVYPILGYNPAQGGFGGLGYFDEKWLGRPFLLRLEAEAATEDAQRVQAEFASPLWSGRLGLGASFDRDANTEFFGFGNASRRERRADYEAIAVRGWLAWQTPAFAGFRVRPAVVLHALTFDSDGGSEPPRLDKNFALATIPAFQDDPDLVELRAELGYESGWLPADSLFAVSFSETIGGSRFQTLSGGDFDFWKYWVAVGTRLQLGKPRRELRARLRLEATDADSGDQVPFVFLPTLGENAGLGGFARGRFVDDEAAVANFEYRFPAWATADGLVFCDLGRVFDDGDEFTLRQWRWAAGLGGEAEMPSKFILRVRIGFSEEGVQPVVLMTRRF